MVVATPFEMLPVYKATHLYTTWCEGDPTNAMFRTTEIRWMNMSAFNACSDKVIVPFARRYLPLCHHEVQLIENTIHTAATQEHSSHQAIRCWGL